MKHLSTLFKEFEINLEEMYHPMDSDDDNEFDFDLDNSDADGGMDGGMDDMGGDESCKCKCCGADMSGMDDEEGADYPTDDDMGDEEGADYPTDDDMGDEEEDRGRGMMGNSPSMMVRR